MSRRACAAGCRGLAVAAGVAEAFAVAAPPDGSSPLPQPASARAAASVHSIGLGSVLGSLIARPYCLAPDLMKR